MTAGRRAVIGGGVWIAWVFLSVPNLHHGRWAEALVLFAALVLVPLIIEVADGPARMSAGRQWLGWAARGQLPAALLLVVSFGMDSRIWAVATGTGWALVLLAMAASGAVQLRKASPWRAVEACNEAGLVFGAVGAAWLMADRAELRPLGFSKDIVLLTAVHFHFAGLILPVLAARALGAVASGKVTTAIAWAVIAGVPSVAVGITATQLGWSGTIESAAAIVMSTAGLAVAVVHVWLGVATRRAVWVRCLWVTAGCSLFAGMLLSALYGVRGFFAPWPWLDIPWMRALHGTVNALGFAGCGTWAWWRVVRRQAAVRLPGRVGA